MGEGSIRIFILSNGGQKSGCIGKDVLECCGLAEIWYRECVPAGRVMRPGIIRELQITYDEVLDVLTNS